MAQALGQGVGCDESYSQMLLNLILNTASRLLNVHRHNGKKLALSSKPPALGKRPTLFRHVW